MNKAHELENGFKREFTLRDNQIYTQQFVLNSEFEMKHDSAEFNTDENFVSFEFKFDVEEDDHSLTFMVSYEFADVVVFMELIDDDYDETVDFETISIVEQIKDDDRQNSVAPIKI